MQPGTKYDDKLAQQLSHRLYLTRQLKTACGHIMSEHQFDVDSNVPLYPAPLSRYSFTQNVISTSVDGSDYLPQLSSKSVHAK